MKTEGLAYHVASVLMRLALVLALFGSLWSVYRTLPADDAATGVAGSENKTALYIQLLPSQDDAVAPLGVIVELYPVDITAVRHEYSSEPRPGIRFDDFLKRQMRGRTPLEARLDQQGHATVQVAPGRWWLHAVLEGRHNIEWRLPINVYGRMQTIQLTSENAYARTKTF